MPQQLSSLPVGALVKDIGTAYYGKPIIFKVMEHNHAGDPEGSTALITEKSITMKCFDAIESTNNDANRKEQGNNRYSYSNIRQWMNSTETSGAWYTAQHSADAPPTKSNTWLNMNAYDQEAGLLANFSKNIRGVLLTVTKRVAKNTVTDGGSYEDVTDKLFLLSTTEIGLTNENNVEEGSIYELFNDESERLICPTEEAVVNSESKHENRKANQPWWWWLRTPITGSSFNVCIVNLDGTRSLSRPSSPANGVCPALAVPSSITVSDTSDTDGAYTIIWNDAPVITTSGVDNLGDKNTPFTINYTITDVDNDNVTVIIKLDTETIQILDNVILGQEYTIGISGAKLNELTVGEHIISITAQDSFENASTKWEVKTAYGGNTND